MSGRTNSARKSERLRKRRQAGVVSGAGTSEPESVELEDRPVIIVVPGEEIQSPSLERTSDNSEHGSDPEGEGLQSEEEDVMTRLKYKRFRGDGNQDADEWLGEFESTAIANQETPAAQRRIFQGLLKGEALSWYQDVPDLIRNDWDQLRTEFLQAFREVGGEARALGRLSTLTMKTNESVRKYGQRVKALM